MIKKALMMLVMATLLAPLSLTATNIPLENIEITAEPPTELERIVINVYWTPQRSLTYDKIVFECTLRQDVQWPRRDGEGYEMKPYEPLSFTYRRENVQFIKDLDQYIHFSVPAGLEELRRNYGVNTFPFDTPVRVSRIRITAYLAGEAVWVLRREVKEVEVDEASM